MYLPGPVSVNGTGRRVCVCVSVADTLGSNAEMVQIWLKSSLRVFNCIMGLGGVAATAYGVLMIRVWQVEGEDSSSHSHHVAVPWFFHAFLGAGVAICAIACLGHIAANTANSLCLSSYMIIVLLLLLLETVTASYVFVNPDWKKVLPKDLAEKLEEFRDFVVSSGDIWKWAACLIFLTQGVCILLATVVRSDAANEVDIYESDDRVMEDESTEHLVAGATIV
ncbi:tetraspanin-19-like [Andrographis paniculata]|uniref:tetraspanin-19-like n=1 Tax=Andrographis paniculata TaxID=175694 RepID=UPI0021E9575A|nr:tetraspanin-19-like [Andrographis paniculata]